MHLVERHEGRLLSEIRALPKVPRPPHINFLRPIRNTDPAWATGCQLPAKRCLLRSGHPTTVATSLRALLKVIEAAMKRSGCDPAPPHDVHDFGYRGVSS